MKIDGRFWLSKDGENFLGSGRIRLLEEIEKTGSISGAAKAMKMSYKAAWERINGMNTLASEPIIKKTTGGKGGGGTTLTPYAHELIATFKRFEELHRQFIERFAEAGDDTERLARILSRTFLTTSARNQLTCRIESIKNKDINGDLRLRLSGGEILYSDITMKSIQNMGLSEGCHAYAIIKSSDIAIYDTPPKECDGVNLFKGRVIEIESIGEKAEITFKIGGGDILVGVITITESKKLQKGAISYAYVSKNHVIVGL
jgi:molybdate transport system regulatory protein